MIATKFQRLYLCFRCQARRLEFVGVSEKSTWDALHIGWLDHSTRRILASHAHGLQVPMIFERALKTCIFREDYFVYFIRFSKYSLHLFLEVVLVAHTHNVSLLLYKSLTLSTWLWLVFRVATLIHWQAAARGNCCTSIVWSHSS